MLSSAVCFLMACIVVLPPAVGYGSDFSSAEQLGNGTKLDTLKAADSHAMYKVTCDEDADFYLSVMYTYAGDLDVYIYDPSQTLFSFDTTSSNPTTLSNTITTAGTYWFNISRWSGSGDAQLTIYISGVEVPIPGFELLAAMLGLILAFGVILVLSRKQTRKIF